MLTLLRSDGVVSAEPFLADSGRRGAGCVGCKFEKDVRGVRRPGSAWIARKLAAEEGSTMLFCTWMGASILLLVSGIIKAHWPVCLCIVCVAAARLSKVEQHPNTFCCCSGAQYPHRKPSSASRSVLASVVHRHQPVSSSTGCNQTKQPPPEITHPPALAASSQSASQAESAAWGSGLACMPS